MTILLMMVLMTILVMLLFDGGYAYYDLSKIVVMIVTMPVI